MTKGAKIGLVLVLGFIILIMVGLASDLSKQPERDQRLQELYDQCVNENDDIMSHEDAVATCDQAKSDAELFS
jgi:hypothetical protein